MILTDIFLRKDKWNFQLQNYFSSKCFSVFCRNQLTCWHIFKLLKFLIICLGNTSLLSHPRTAKVSLYADGVGKEESHSSPLNEKNYARLVRGHAPNNMTVQQSTFICLFCRYGSSNLVKTERASLGSM